MCCSGKTHARRKFHDLSATRKSFISRLSSSQSTTSEISPNESMATAKEQSVATATEESMKTETDIGSRETSASGHDSSQSQKSRKTTRAQNNYFFTR